MSSRRRDNFKLTFLAKNSEFIPLFLYKLLKFLFYKFKACLFIIGNKLGSIDANSFTMINYITFFYYSFLKIKVSVV